ncbi:MAG: class B sortase [Oscillospiraceae bacterium]|nr:class B sortase [Oscillospiraceae bacterium]
MENNVLKTEFCAYLFPAVKADVEKRLEEENFPKGTALSCRLGENGVVIEVQTENEKEVKALIEKLFGSAVYSFETEDFAEIIVKKLLDREKKISIAESCTGGLLSKRITDIPGASAVFELGMTVYSDEAKAEILNVSEKTLNSYGAVSRQTAEELAQNVRHTAASDIGISITGFAGPDESSETQVGLVYIGIATKDGYTAQKLELGENKSRDAIRKETILFALYMINQALEETEVFKNMLISSADKISPKKFLLKVKDAALKAVRYLIPFKGDERSEIIRKSVFLVAICVFIGSSVYIGNYFLTRLSTDRQYEKLQSITDAPATKEQIANLPEGYLEKFASLYEINEDIVGWVKVGDTIDLPVVITKDNDFYLQKDFYKKDNFHGVPFMDYRCSPRLNNTNTVIYGHNVKPDRMFASLLNYRKLAFYKENPIFTYDSVYEESAWKVLYVMITDGNPNRGEYFDYHNFINATTDEEFYDFIDECKKRTIINTTVDVHPSDKLLTLSTCGFDFSDERVVVVARKVREGETEDVDVARATANPKVLMPDIWYSIWGGTKPTFEESSKVNEESDIINDESLPEEEVSSEDTASAESSETKTEETIE